MAPTVLHFIICEQVRLDAQNLHSISVRGLITSIRSRQKPPFPLQRRNLTALAIFMGGEGSGELSFRIVQDDTRRVISHSKKPLRIRFLGDLQAVKGIKINVPNCTFPREGLYWVELVYSGAVIARQPIRLFS